MSEATTTSSFELRGEYCGFIRTLLGKKRMVLCTGREETFLKVPKDLRHQLQALLKVGTEITVTGFDAFDEEHGRVKRLVSDVRLTASGESLACVRCPIRVCAKKNCWRNGGRELWHALEHAVAQRGAGDKVELEAVHCLDHCKRAPNAEWRGLEFHRCTPMDAERIVATALGEDPDTDRHR